MVLGIDLVIGAGLVDGNEIHHMEIISYVDDTTVLNAWLELILTAVLIFKKLVIAVSPAFLELWSKTYPKFS